MAIHEADFHVELPSTIDQAPWSSPDDEGPISPTPSERGCTMEYFLEVIRFSHIVGSVIRGLYRPSQVDLSPDVMLHSASGLDQRLSEWKASLPRNLRFDLGHTFEKSISFRRQVGSLHSQLRLCPLPIATSADIDHIAQYASGEISSSARTCSPAFLVPSPPADEQPAFHESTYPG